MNMTTNVCGVRERWTVRLAPATSRDLILRLLPKRLPPRAAGREKPQVECASVAWGSLAGQMTLPGLLDQAVGIEVRKGYG